MDVMQHIERLFDYDDWANRETFANLQAAATPAPRALRLLNHVIGGELLWLARLESRPSPCPVWPDFSLAQCGEQIRELPRRWRDYFADTSPADLTETISYVNSKTEPWTSSVADVLTHVCLHGAYHRGQIATEVRAAGRDPAFTDFIHCTRAGLI